MDNDRDYVLAPDRDLVISGVVASAGRSSVHAPGMQANTKVLQAMFRIYDDSNAVLFTETFPILDDFSDGAWVKWNLPLGSDVIDQFIALAASKRLHWEVITGCDASRLGCGDLMAITKAGHSWIVPTPCVGCK